MTDTVDVILLPLVVPVSATVVVSDPLPARSKGTTPLPLVAPVIAIPESVIIIMNIHKFTSNIKHHLLFIINFITSFHHTKAIPNE